MRHWWGGRQLLSRYVPFKTFSSERQSCLEIATVCVVYCLLSFRFVSFDFYASSVSFHTYYIRRQNSLSVFLRQRGLWCRASLARWSGRSADCTAICVVQMSVWQPYGRPFKTLAGLPNHLYSGHFVVVLIHQTINPLLDSFLSFSTLTL